MCKILVGGFVAAYVSLIIPVIVALTPDMNVVGTWMGMSLFVAAFGLLIGTPVEGPLVDIQKKQFVGVQGFAGVVILFGALLMLTALVRRARQLKSWKGLEGILMCQCSKKGRQSITTLLLLRLRGVQLKLWIIL